MAATISLVGSFDLTTDSGYLTNGCDTSHKHLPWSDLIKYKFTIDVIIVSALVCFGCIGNIVCIFLLRRNKSPDFSSTIWLLQWLAVADSLYLISCIFIQPFKFIHNYTNWWPQLDTVHPYISRYLWPAASTAQTLAVWLVVLVTVDRYLLIWKPASPWQQKQKYVCVTLVTTILAAFAYNIPRLFERDILQCDEDRAITVFTGLRTNAAYFLLYKVLCYILFRSLGPLLSLLYFNVRLYKSMKQAQWQQGLMSARHHSVTAMLVAMVTVFILCQFPSIIVRLLSAGSQHYQWFSINQDTLQYVNTLANALLTLNSSVNFIIYYCVGQSFRTHCAQVFCKCCRHEGHEDHSGTEMVGLTQA